MALTGFRIDTYMDVNPNSPTFQQTKEERVSDSDCVAGGSQWEVVSEYCETDDDGANTGYYVTVSMDVGVGSPTYGETRESRTMNRTECPESSKDPEYSIDMTDAYCVTKHYPKSGLDGETGELHVILTDENINSPTFGETKEGTITIDDWDDDAKAEYGEFPCEAVDETPQVEPISEACETVPDEYGTLVFNGYKTVTGIDKNPYSDTYLETVTQRVLDNAKCPAAEDAKFYYRDGMTDELTTRDVRVEWYKRDYTIYVTSSRGSGILPYSVAVPNASWISYDKPTEDALIFTIEKNMNTSERTQTITMTQERTAKECTIRFTQETPPYYFYLDNSSTTAKTISVGAAATSQTVNITSLWGDEYKDYNTSGLPTWASVTRNSASKTITFSIQANSNTTSRSATVTLTQQTSGKQCRVTINQAAYTPQPSDYNFLVSDASIGNTSWQTAITLSFDEGSTSKYAGVTSDNGFGESVMWGYTFDSGSGWINVVKQGNVLRIYPNENTSTASRSGRIKLEQDGSNKICYITVNQSGKAVVAYNFQVSTAQSGSYSTEVTYNMDSGIGTKTVYVKSSSTNNNNVGWSASITTGSSWIKIPTEQDSLLVFTIDGNTSTSSRTGKITLTQNESSEKCTINIVQSGKVEENENTPEYVQTYGEKFSYGATGNYDFSQLWVTCEVYSIEEGFYNAGSETQNSGDVYVLDKFLNTHEYIEFRVYARDPGISGIYFYFGDFNFEYTSESDFNIKTGMAGQVNGKQIKVRVTRLNEIPMSLSMDAEVEETE